MAPASTTLLLPCWEEVKQNLENPKRKASKASKSKQQKQKNRYKNKKPLRLLPQPPPPPASCAYSAAASSRNSSAKAAASGKITCGGRRAFSVGRSRRCFQEMSFLGLFSVENNLFFSCKGVFSSRILIC